MIVCPTEDSFRGEHDTGRNNHLQLTAGLDEHRQFPDDPSARDRSVGIAARHSHVTSFDDVENAEASTKSQLIVDEVERPACVDLGVDRDRHTGSDRSAPGSALANLQSFLR
jgi:hypothetical protein